MITEKDKKRAEELFPISQKNSISDNIANGVAYGEQRGYLQACEEKNQEMFEFVEWVGINNYIFRGNQWWLAGLDKDFDYDHILVANSTEELYQLFLKEKEQEK